MPPLLNPALRDFWKQRARNRVLHGGRASSKSHDAAGKVIDIAVNCRVRVLCVRQFQNKIADSIYTLLKTKIEAFGYEHLFKITDNSIICLTSKSEFMFYGLARNITEIKSLEGIDILLSEESHLLTQEQWDILEPTIRKESSECWLLFNARFSTDFVWKRFVVNPPKNTIIRHINYDENPFLSKTMHDIIDAAKTEDLERYTHIYLGQPLSDDDEAVIKRSWIVAAIDAHIKLGIIITGSKRIGFDVADSGDDECATVSAHGSLINDVKKWRAKEDELLQSCTKAWTQAHQEDSMIFYDAIGVGASCGAKFNEINEVRQANVKHKKFFAGGSPEFPDAFYAGTSVKNRDFFANIKSQKWWCVAKRLENTYNAVTNGQAFRDDEMIFIDSKVSFLEQLTEELSTPKKSFDSAGRVMVESKKDLKKRGIMSPNIADAFIMSMLVSTERLEPIKPKQAYNPHAHSWQS
jgi:phage terminase large subunit